MMSFSSGWFATKAQWMQLIRIQLSECAVVTMRRHTYSEHTVSKPLPLPVRYNENSLMKLAE